MRKKFAVPTLAAVALGYATSAATSADLVVGTFGGSNLDAVNVCHAEPYTQKTGNKVVTKLANSSQFASMVRATAGTSDMDVITIDDSLATQLANEGLLEKIDTSKLKSSSQFVDGIIGKDSQYIVYQWSSTTIAYNPKLVKTPPTSWSDVFNPEYAGKLALPDISGTAGVHFLIAANRLGGGTLDNLQEGLKRVKALAPNSVAFYTQADQLVSMFERGEIAIAPWYTDRAAVAEDKGAPVKFVYPSEGGIGVRVALVIPKGTKNPDAALAFVDQVLSKEAQECFAEKMYGGPVNKTAVLKGRAAEVVPPDQYGKLYFLDPEVVSKSVASWRQRWQREIAR
jgi:putative spermidine/putrescine transport system substrate-binding protein